MVDQFRKIQGYNLELGIFWKLKVSGMTLLNMKVSIKYIHGCYKL